MIGGSMQPQQDVYDELMGRPKFSGSFSEQFQNNVEPVDFMHGLRCGGPPSCMVDAWVIRSGQPFSSGQNWLRVAFSQR